MSKGKRSKGTKRGERNWTDLSPEESEMARKEIGELRELLVQGERQQWVIGSLASKIKITFRLTLKAIHEELKPPYTFAYFKDLVRIAEREEFRDEGFRQKASPSHAMKSLPDWASLPKAERELTSPVEYALESLATGKTTREMRKDTMKRKLKDHKEACAKTAKQLLEKHPDLLEQFRKGDCLTVLEEIAAQGSFPIQLLHCDVPYPGYRKRTAADMKDRKLDYNAGSWAEMRHDCENKESGKALKLSIDLVKMAPRVLAPKGVMLLYQAALRPLDWRITKEIEDQGLECWELHIPKRKTQVGNPNDALSYSSEKLIVIFRAGCNPEDLSAAKLSRRETLNEDQLAAEIRKVISPDELAKEAASVGMDWDTGSYANDVKKGTREVGDAHFMAKPEFISRWLIEKFSVPEQLCIDCCGCSGSFSQAAGKMNRRWVYCEMHPDNFNWGVVKISGALAVNEAMLPETAEEQAA